MALRKGICTRGESLWWHFYRPGRVFILYIISLKPRNNADSVLILSPLLFTPRKVEAQRSRIIYPKLHDRQRKQQDSDPPSDSQRDPCFHAAPASLPAGPSESPSCANPSTLQSKKTALQVSKSPEQFLLESFRSIKTNTKVSHWLKSASNKHCT